MTLVMTVWTYFKACLMTGAPILAYFSYRLLGTSPVTGLLFVLIVWVQVCTFMEMNAHTRIRYEGVDDAVLGIANEKEHSALIAKIDRSGAPDQSKEEFAAFGRACFERGAEQAVLRVKTQC